MNLSHTDIPWTLERVDLIEDVSLLALTDYELLLHARLQQREIVALRGIVRAALQQLHDKDRDIEQQRREASRLREELRARRQMDSRAA